MIFRFKQVTSVNKVACELQSDELGVVTEVT